MTTQSAIALLLDAALLTGAIIVFTRLVGLRSFSKFTSFDFALTVAIGSIVGSAIFSTKPDALQAMLAIGGIFLFQMLVSFLRARFDIFETATDNAPLLLVQNGELLADNIRRARLRRCDVIAKVREANALRLSDVHAVVFEATGDISVLHGGQGVDDELLEDVKRS